MASLAANALFVGGLVSAFVRHGAVPTQGQPGPQRNIGAYVSSLPSARSEAIWRNAAEKRKALALGRRELRKAREDAMTALTAEPFDKGKFEAAETRLIEAEHAQRLGQRDLLADIAGAMTPDERRAFVRWRGPPRSGGGTEPPPPKE